MGRRPSLDGYGISLPPGFESETVQPVAYQVSIQTTSSLPTPEWGTGEYLAISKAAAVYSFLFTPTSNRAQ